MAARKSTRTSSPPPTTPKPVAVGYARCSTGMQDQSVSDQVAAIERWARENGHVLAEAPFFDDGVSGGDLEREGLLALFDHVERRPSGGTVVIWDLSRFARADDPLDGLIMERRISRAGWKLHFLHGAARTGDALADGLVGLVGHHQAGQFRRSIALSSTRGMATSMRTGTSWRGPAPFGYAKQATWADGRVQVIPRGVKVPTRDAVSVKLVPGDVREVEALRSIFDDYATGRGGVIAIAMRLATAAAPAPGPSWRSTTVAAILANPVYVGSVVWNRRSCGKLVRFTDGVPTLRKTKGESKNAKSDWIVVENAHDPLVSRKVWERAQAVREGRGRERGGARRSERYPLSGILVCGACGGPLVMRNPKIPEKRDSEARYICKGVDPVRPCRCYAIHECVVEAAVQQALHQHLSTLNRTKLRMSIIKVLQQAMTKEGGAHLSKLASEERDLLSRISKTVDLLPEVDKETARSLSEKVRTWRARLAEVVAARRDGEAKRAPEVRPEQVADEVLALVDQLDRLPTAGRPERRAFYEAVVQRVVIHHESRHLGRRLLYVPVRGEAMIRGPLTALQRPLSGDVSSGDQRLSLR